MRKFPELKKEWQAKTKYHSNYEISIGMMDSEYLELFVDLKINGEVVDSECIMEIDGIANGGNGPTKEMLAKFKYAVNYFKKYFYNVTSNSKVIVV